MIEINYSDSLSTIFDVFNAEQLSGRPKLMKPNTPELLNSTEFLELYPWKS